MARCSLDAPIVFGWPQLRQALGNTAGDGNRTQDTVKSLALTKRLILIMRGATDKTPLKKHVDMATIDHNMKGSRERLMEESLRTTDQSTLPRAPNCSPVEAPAKPLP